MFSTEIPNHSYKDEKGDNNTNSGHIEFGSPDCDIGIHECVDKSKTN